MFRWMYQKDLNEPFRGVISENHNGKMTSQWVPRNEARTRYFCEVGEHVYRKLFRNAEADKRETLRQAKSFLKIFAWNRSKACIDRKSYNVT